MKSLKTIVNGDHYCRGHNETNNHNAILCGGTLGNFDTTRS